MRVVLTEMKDPSRTRAHPGKRSKYSVPRILQTRKRKPQLKLIWFVSDADSWGSKSLGGGSRIDSLELASDDIGFLSKIATATTHKMSTEEDPHSNKKKREDSGSQSDTQGGDLPLDMTDQEEEETSMNVNDHHAAPDQEDEQVDEKID